MKEPMPKSCHEFMMENQTPSHPYLPLFVVIAISCVLGFIQTKAMGHFMFHHWMDVAMGYYLVLMATMKFFDLPMFARNFQQYDIISKILPGYCYTYPFIELALGALFINNIQAMNANIIMLVVMTSSLVGIIFVLIKGEVEPCSCMGPALSVPLGIASVLECGVMIAMAIMNLIMMKH